MAGDRRVLVALFGVVFCGLAANLYYTYVVSLSVAMCRQWGSGGSDVPLRTAALRRDKRRAWRHRRQYNPEDRKGPSVEFFPKPQPTEQTEDHVWLTSYSRIPLPVLKDYCFSAKEYCPKGEPGPPGDAGSEGAKGDKGDRGDRGIPGESGPRGPAGIPGHQGPVGPPGEAGSPGLDGRDGLPGYPGLDGVPGRDGVDGINGKDGIPGIPGTPGRSGYNGTNGIPGSPGARGPPGPAGAQGLPGPRGRKGIPGKPGNPGVPGINTWKLNGTHISELLIPPSIVDVEQQTTVMVQEGENVRLKCSATGSPLPEISWRKDDTTPILMGSTYLTSIKGDRVNFTRVSRDQIGMYMCIASNGIPPPAFKRIRLEVTFPPLIKIRNQMVGTRNGSFAVLECFVEAFPQAVNYWLFGDGRLLEGSWKYVMKQQEESYKNHLVLNITFIEPSDYGMYKCVSKNEKGTTLGVFTVFEIDPTIPTRSPQESTFTVYGQVPPPRVIEPECPPCPDCPTQQRCTSRGQGKLDSFRVESLHDIYEISKWRLYPRSKDCMISQIGKPVFSRYTDADFGSWMQDTLPSGPEEEKKYYVTLESDHSHLYEYADKTQFRKNNHTKKHPLTYSFHGNGHVVFNGSFYYHRQGTSQLVRLNLNTNHTNFMYIDIGPFQNATKIYNVQHNYLDVSADENGLWVIFAGNKTSSNNTMIMKFHPDRLVTEFMWSITLDHHNVGDMFITCGVLYVVDNVVQRNTQITFAFDLYRNKLIEANLNFSNPFRQNNMISYNPKHEMIVTWDKGNQLIYPVKFGTLDLDQPDAEEEEH